MQVGGGPTGTELAAEMHDLVVEDMVHFFPDLKVLPRFSGSGFRCGLADLGQMVPVTSRCRLGVRIKHSWPGCGLAWLGSAAPVASVQSSASGPADRLRCFWHSVKFA